MENIEQLFIRACKSLEPKKRVFSVYRRFYLQCDDPTPHLVDILTSIIDKYVGVSARSMIDDLSPSNAWKFDGDCEPTYINIVLNVLISRIRLTARDKFPNMRSPAKFRIKLSESNYVVHYTKASRPPVPCDTIDEVWTAIGKRSLSEGYGVESPKGLDVSEFIPL